MEQQFLSQNILVILDKQNCLSYFVHLDRKLCRRFLEEIKNISSVPYPGGGLLCNILIFFLFAFMFLRSVLKTLFHRLSHKKIKIMFLIDFLSPDYAPSTVFLFLSS